MGESIREELMRMFEGKVDEINHEIKSRRTPEGDLRPSEADCVASRYMQRVYLEQRIIRTGFDN